MLCGYRSYSAIGQWGRTYPPQLAVVLGFTYPKTPCASTFHYCFKTIDTVALEKTLSEWAAGVLYRINLIPLGRCGYKPHRILGNMLKTSVFANDSVRLQTAP